MVKKNDSEEDFSLLKYNAGTLLTWNISGRTPLTTKPKIERTKHAMLGLIDECGEISKIFKKMVGYDKDFDRTGLIEELGDFLYYLVRLADESGFVQESINERFVENFDRTINWKQVTYKKELSATDYCVELTKRVYLINSSVNSYELPEHIIEVLPILKRFALYSGTNMVKVAEANRKKLLNRHGNSYNPDNLEQRDSEEERKTIESTL